MPSAAEPTMSDPGWPRIVSAWNTFWFTPRDPTVLGCIRIGCGLITFYTMLMYSFMLQDSLGPNAWFDREAVEEALFQRPVLAGPLNGRETSPLRARTQAEELYGQDYHKKFGEWPPAPAPQTALEADFCEQYRVKFNFDLRAYGLEPPRTAKQRDDLMAYTELWKRPMPPPYPETDEEVQFINDYLQRYNIDPRRLYARGMPNWSVWFHLTDPFWMGLTHGLFVLAALLFTVGCFTRVTSFLTWFAALNYIHRDTVALFGVDTMMTILLLYLTIGPSGAAFSVDRCLARWWKRRRAGGTPLPPEPPQPSVSANLAIRLLQVHVCIIYGMAGFSKLQGAAWWNGTALWSVLANFEFAPMHYVVYNDFLRFLGKNQLVFELFMTGGAFFTVAFEILYSFWIWGRTTRWIILSAAFLLHGVIGLFMGLQTFALIMLVMNMAFLQTHEVYWLLGFFGIEVKPPGKAAPRPADAAALASGKVMTEHLVAEPRP
jgi:hypothetical protein